MSQNPYQIDAASLDWSDQQTPQSEQFGDVYFSRESGLEETRFVFLQHNQLTQRFAQLASGERFCIGETGFGTGLNFLACWQHFQQHAPAGARLHYVAVDRYPLRTEDLHRAHQAWPELAELAHALHQVYPPLIPGQHCLLLEGGRITLHLLWGDVAEQFAQQGDTLAASGCQVDAWFLDGFAPARNPGMWTAATFAQLARFSHPNTTYATFTAAGVVKRGLREVGFSVRKVPGFGRKREMLTGQFQACTLPQPSNDYWAQVPPSRPVQQVAVIGGGLAGALMSEALRRRGLSVTLIEREPTLATQASGNRQGVIYTKLSHQRGRLGDYGVASYGFALRRYADWLTQPDVIGDLCGVLQLATDTKQQEQQQHVAEAFAGHGWLTPVDAERATALSQWPIDHPALHYPQGGWVNPPSLCRALTANVERRLGCAVNALQSTAHGWCLQLQDGTTLEADAVVVANAWEARQLLGDWLPLRRIRGQVTHLSHHNSSPACVICHDGYISPDWERALCLGATFDLHNDSLELQADSQQENLDKLQAALPGLQLPIHPPLRGKVGIRTTSPDYLPLAGPVPNVPRLQQIAAPLARNAKTSLTEPGAYLPGLYLLAGLGSKGLSYGPIAAELIAAQICGDWRPLPMALQQALNPARFIIRDLVRGRTTLTSETEANA